MAVADEIDVTTPVAAMLLLNLLVNWAEGGVDAVEYAWDMIEPVWPAAVAPEGGLEARLLRGAFEAACGLAAAERLGAPDPEAFGRAARGFDRLAGLLRGAGHAADALACAQSGCNLLRLSGDLAGAERACARALDAARELDDPDMIVAELARRCDILVRHAEEEAGRRRDAFDAFEAALRAVLERGVRPKMVMRLLKGWVVDVDYLHIFQATLALLVPEEERRELPVLAEALRRYTGSGDGPLPQELLDLPAVLSPVWGGTTQEWLKHLDTVRAWSIPFENRRLALEPPPDGEAALVEWGDWAFRHPNLLRAVPHNESLLREERRDELLLVLHHEITHVYSLMGFLGLALLSMRLAAYQLELDLWDALRQRGLEFEETGPYSPGVLAPLAEADAIVLGQAEQGVEVQRKVQALQNCWAPWLEGLAVFGETAADPRTDADAYPPVIGVVSNLWDTPVAQLAQDRGLDIRAAAAARHSEAEGLFARALESEGRSRLFLYFGSRPNARKYLPGYLAVRAVVAAWRATLGHPLSGAEAFAALLHATRFSDFSVIPDPALPADEFRREAVRRHADWVAALARAPRADLEEVHRFDPGSGDRGHGLRWSGGRLQSLGEQEAEAETYREAGRLTERALRSMHGEFARPGRVPGASPECLEVMRAMAGALTVKPVAENLASPESLDHFLGGGTVLPLGQAECPFWLLPETHSVAVLIRTREKDKDHGKPSYDVLVFNVSEESFAGLLREAHRIGAGRIRVTRVADLLQQRRTVVGRQVLAFQLGDWIEFEYGGTLTGAPEVKAELCDRIRDRLAPSPFRAHQRWLTGEGTPAAARTRRWIEASDWEVTEVGYLKVDLRAWAARVSALAGEVTANDGREEAYAAAETLLTALTGHPGLASGALAAVEALRVEEPHLFTGLIDLLFSSGLRPQAETAGAQAIVEALQERGAPLLERTLYGWDAARPPTAT